MKKKWTPVFWAYCILFGIVSLLLLAYSYTQVDLSLTLSKASIVQDIQKVFQHIGYFNRSVSAGIFSVIILTMFVLYGFILRDILQKRLALRDVWILIAVLILFLVISYPAFSYDFYNYLFTAKTVLIYHKNPYAVIPLQFAGIDPWLSFMHWTHLPSAYTPLWIATSLPAYFLGFGYLLTLIWSLKLVMVFAYIATIKGIQKVLDLEKSEYTVLGMAIVAFNPLIIIETLVSPHNDIVMMAIAVWSIVLYREKRIWLSWLLLSVSVAMKLMTIFLIPAFFLKWNKKIALFCISLGFMAVLTQREVLSWYWIWIVPFVALLPEYIDITILSAGISMGLVLRYVPYLYLGHWNDPVPEMKFWLTCIPVVISCVIIIVRRYIKYTRK